MYRTYQTPKSRMAFSHLAKDSSGEGYHWTSLFHLQAGCNDCLGYKRRTNYLHSDDQFTASVSLRPDLGSFAQSTSGNQASAVIFAAVLLVMEDVNCAGQDMRA
jgi:hypothetical protein